MKYAIVAISILTLMYAWQNPGSIDTRSAEIIVHDGNQVEMCVSNFGKFGQTQMQGAGCWWPKGSGQNYIFGAGIWFGTVDSTTGLWQRRK